MPAVPEDHKKPAAQIEAEGDETVEVAWRDLTFTVAASADDWPTAAQLAFEDGRSANGLRIILGPEQWAAHMKTNPKKRDTNSLFDALAEALGLDSGE